GERGQEPPSGFHVRAALQRRPALVDPLGHALLDATLEPGLSVPSRLVVLVDEERDLPLVERAAELALALEPVGLRARPGGKLLAGRERRRRPGRARRGLGGCGRAGLTIRRRGPRRAASREERPRHQPGEPPHLSSSVAKTLRFLMKSSRVISE